MHISSLNQQLVNSTAFCSVNSSQLQLLDDHVVKGFDLVKQEIAKLSMVRGFYIGMASAGSIGFVLQFARLIRRRQLEIMKDLPMNDSQQEKFDKMRAEQEVKSVNDFAGVLVDKSKVVADNYPIGMSLDTDRATKIIMQARGMIERGQDPRETEVNQFFIQIYLARNGISLNEAFQNQFRLTDKQEDIMRKELVKYTALKKAFNPLSYSIPATSREIVIFFLCFMAVWMFGWMWKNLS